MDQDLKVKSTWKVHSLNWSRIWLKLFPELQWNENMVINCDMWCCPEWTVGLEAVLEPNYVFVQFWKERGNCKTASTAHSTQQKNSKWGFSLKSFTGQTPSWPLLPQKLCPNWSNKLTPCASDICKSRSKKILAVESKKDSALQILSSDDMRDGGLDGNSLYWEKQQQKCDRKHIYNIFPLNLLIFNTLKKGLRFDNVTWTLRTVHDFIREKSPS